MSDDELSPRESLRMAGVVHDVNQMLSVISGRAGLLLNQDVDPRWKPHLEAMLLASSDAAAMMRRLSSAAGDERRDERANLHQTAEQARLLVWPGEDDDFEWRNEIDPAVFSSVPAQILREVLANLLLNALVLMPEGGRMQLSVQPVGDGRVELRVEDSGPGLPAGDPEQVFKPGFSGSGKVGRGIGLAGCRQLLTSWDAELHAENQSSVPGAVFRVGLPTAPVAESRPGGGPTSELPAMSVIVVDDEAVVRDMLSDVMRTWGCDVQCFADSRSALTAYRSGAAAVALIDRNLPGMDGLELASLLRANDSCLSIVLMTGWQRAGDLAPSDPAVVDGMAEKPLAIERLREVLSDGYEKYSARQADQARP